MVRYHISQNLILGFLRDMMIFQILQIGRKLIWQQLGLIKLHLLLHKWEAIDDLFEALPPVQFLIIEKILVLFYDSWGQVFRLLAEVAFLNVSFVDQYLLEDILLVLSLQVDLVPGVFVTENDRELFFSKFVDLAISRDAIYTHWI